MKKVKKIGVVLGILILLVCLVSLLFPTNVEVSRSIAINASVENVFDNVNTIEHWKKWGGPWHEEGMDYTTVIKRTEGASSGVGSRLIYNQGKGEGSVEIIESNINQKIKTLISFEDGGSANGIWLFDQNNNKTNVTWTIYIDLGYNPLKRIMGNLMMESKVGPLFEIGLSNLKKVSE
ncbi:SRPBCC family protein [Aquimarina sp. 2201CG1-2-11]|uniref:SRPBCC family protein n=1 Tax=Aquimarina discodermiae TaxID=3231043 RepID=UPI0034631817